MSATAERVESQGAILPEPFDPALDDADIDVDTRLALYRRQQEIRQLEKRLHDLFLQNLVKGTSHLALGMEAAAAAFGVALRPDDYTFATYRGHGHTIARGVPAGPIIAEMLGRGTGLLGGKGGSMHLTSVEHGMMGSYAIVGAHLCIANGAAWSARLRGTDQVAVAFFGDGATNIGAFHEALNFAAVYQLPTIFVCENNLYMEYTAIGEVTAVRHPAADRAAAYGLEPTVVDGNDADAVYLAAQTAIERARAGGGPSLIETKTYRHGGHSRADPGTYRPPRRSRRGSPTTRSRCTTSACSASASPRSGSPRSSRAWRRRSTRRPRQAKAARAAGSRPSCGPTCGPTGGGSGAADLPGGGVAGHRPGDAPRPDRRVPRRGRRRRRRRVQDHRRAARRVRSRARPRHADLRAGDPRGGDGGGDDRHAPDRRDHVRRLLRRLLGHGRQRDRQGPLHDQRAGQLPAGDQVRQRRLGALRRPALPERRELGDVGAGDQGRRPVERRRTSSA